MFLNGLGKNPIDQLIGHDNEEKGKELPPFKEKDKSLCVEMISKHVCPLLLKRLSQIKQCIIRNKFRETSCDQKIDPFISVWKKQRLMTDITSTHTSWCLQM